VTSIRYCAQADRYKKYNCCEAKIQTKSDNPQGYDALCDNCKIVQMQDDLKERNDLLEKAYLGLKREDGCWNTRGFCRSQWLEEYEAMKK